MPIINFKTPIKIAQPDCGIILATGMAILGYALRYLFIEPDANGAICEINGPWWCLPRTILIMATEWNMLGIMALVCALLAIFLKYHQYQTEVIAMTAMAIGGAGLLLYNASFSAIAVVLAGLVLAMEIKH